MVDVRYDHQGGHLKSVPSRSYIYMQSEEAVNISALILEGVGSDSGDSDSVPPQSTQAPFRRLTKRARLIHPIYFCGGKRPFRSPSPRHQV